MAGSYRVGKVVFARMSALSEIDVFITDDGITKDWRRKLEATGAKVIIAS